MINILEAVRGIFLEFVEVPLASCFGGKIITLKLAGTVTLTLLLGVGMFAQDAIPAVERQALIALYDSTNGDGWTDSSGWKTPPLYTDGFAMPGTEAGWYGLTIDSGTQQVTQINLPDNNLTGSLPTEVGNLTGLIWLYLDNNQLGGSIPASLGDLTVLRELHLYSNQLTGSIPAEIGNLSNLYFIDLGNNQLSGSIPMEIGNLTQLYKLCLNDNQLSGPIPVELGGLSNLGYLYLNTNQLSGSIPLELCHLPNLRHLILWANKLSGTIPPQLGNLTGLTWIVLRYNQFTGEIPAELGNLANLQVLRLGDNQLSGKVPAELGNLTNLQSLRLSHNQLSGEIPDSLGNLTQLWEMLINSNQLTGPVPTSLANLTALTTTDFGYNALYSSDEALITFLNTKDPDWAATQTIAPTGITATSLDNAVIMVSWLPVTYTANAGYCRVLISEALGGPYTLAGQTEDKATSWVQVSGLTPGRRYYFVVQTVTNAHTNNQNIVESAYSTEATAIAWLQTQVQISGTVLVSGSPLAGVVMSGLPEGTVTDALGAYGATVAVDFSGTVTPILAGYTFDPLSKAYAHLTTNQTAQDYAAAIVVPTITVTSPDGGETWRIGSTHDVTWTQAGLTGSVTIDLYKGGVYQKRLGTADATADSFSWLIGAGETIGAEYTILVWQNGNSDDSDASFAVVPAAKVDFNGDGQEDILWRYQGTGVFEGINCVWLMNQTQGLSSIPLGATQMEAMTSGLSKAAASGLSHKTPMEAGNLLTSGSVKSSRFPVRLKDLSVLSKKSAKKSPMGLDRGGALRTKRSKKAIVPSVPTVRDAEMISAGVGGTIGIASLTAVGYLYPQSVWDLDWEIAGAGDFDGDGDADILWRNYGAGPFSGFNCIWYMNGAENSGYSYPDRVMDLDWRIVGTGDFDGDGDADILWRNTGAGQFTGFNCIWYMNGAGVSGYSYPDRVMDLDWEIVGTGDFNRDGSTDILWRNTGAGQFTGFNCIWYMSGGGVSGYAYPDRVLDLDWKIEGTGDFNKDGYTDILWRYYGGGAIQGYNCVWYMQNDRMIGVDYPMSVPDTNWRIVNR